MNLHAVRDTNGLSPLLYDYLNRHNPNYRFWWNAELNAMQYNHRDPNHTYHTLSPITVTPSDLRFFEMEAQTWQNRGRR